MTMKANVKKSKEHVENSTAYATALLGYLKYSEIEHIVELANKEKCSIRTAAIKSGYCTEEKFNELTSPENVLRIGIPPKKDNNS